MTELVSCPRCGDALDIPVELLGKPVRCASCRSVFTPAPADTIPTAPRARRAWTRPRDDADDAPPARPSNLWVWLVTGGLVFVFGLITLGCTGFLRDLLNPTMTVHTSAEGRFQVAMPGTPVTVSQTDNGRPVVGLEATRHENQEVYKVLSAELPPALKKLAKAADREKTEELFAELAKVQLPGLAAGAEVHRELNLDGKYPTLDVRVQQGGGWAKKVAVVRFLVANDRVYVLVAGGANLEPHLWYVRRFFTSFEPLPPK